MKRFKKWQRLNQYLEQRVFAFIDLVFAESVLKNLNSEKEEHAALLAALFALSRQGHLTLDLSKDLPNFATVQPPPKLDPLMELVRLGAETFPRQGFVEVQSGESISTFTTSENHFPPALICRMQTCFYLQRNWVFETEIIRHLQRLNHHPPSICFSLQTLNACLNEAQRKAVENAMIHSLSLLTGGPGTGKTFTAAELVKSLIAAFPAENQRKIRIILTAPTGKAVAQLEGNLKISLDSKVTIVSGTLHSILGIREYAEEEEDDLTLFADLIIVDECSMIDAKIFSRLLASVPSGARLILIGDKDQLPPVEAGSIFADLIDSEIYPSTCLTECLRSDRKKILTFSNEIKGGDAKSALQLIASEEISKISSSSSEIVWIDLDSTKKDFQHFYTDLWKEYNDRFLSIYLERPSAEQIFNSQGRFTLLSSLRQGPLGVEALNRYFISQSIKQIETGSWVAAPIMITRNDHELQLYNGDVGFLIRKFTDEFSLRQFHLDDYILFQDRKGAIRQIASLSMTSFELSYCLSVHKSQGSEYDEAVIIIPPGSELFGREVLYTAITRVRRKLTLVCSKDLFAKVIATSSRKLSGLHTRLVLCQA